MQRVPFIDENEQQEKQMNDIRSKYKFYITFLVIIWLNVLLNAQDPINNERPGNDSTQFALNSANGLTRPLNNGENAMQLFGSENLSGNWWGIRSALIERGINLQVIYKGEVWSNLSGGLEKGSVLLDNTDIILDLDLDKSLGLNGTSFILQFLGNSGRLPCEYVGVQQGISNIETIPTWKIFQMYIEQKLFDEKLSIILGMFDLNSEFDARESSSIFLNPSHGIGPDFAKSGLNGPSIFPTTSIALKLGYEFDSGYFLKWAVFDGVPGNPDNPYGTHIFLSGNDGILFTAETGYAVKKEDMLISKFSVGSWIYSSDFDENIAGNIGVENRSTGKNYGLYLNWEHRFNETSAGSCAMYFLRVGMANKKINPIDFYAGTGFNIKGIFDSGNNDNLGVALAVAHNSSYYREFVEKSEEIQMKEFEINMEVTYTLPITPWLILQPDLQYFINPTFCSLNDSSLLFGTRLRVSL